jgi:hypothetical protein
LGIGPAGLRVFKETRLGPGKFLEVDGKVISLDAIDNFTL